MPAGSTASTYGPVREVAWTAADGVGHPSDVGARLPNLHGLFDTLGDVWEWCSDVYDEEGGGDARVHRGGGWSDAPGFVRATARRGGRPRDAFDDVGVRVARG